MHTLNLRLPTVTDARVSKDDILLILIDESQLKRTVIVAILPALAYYVPVSWFIVRR
jgi:hypothetical protein